MCATSQDLLPFRSEHSPGLQSAVYDLDRCIIGDRGFGGGPRSSDGVVPYSSSHLAGAESEKIVPAGHSVFSNESAVLEIKRILEENIERPTDRGTQNGSGRETKDEGRRTRNTRPASLFCRAGKKRSFGL